MKRLQFDFNEEELKNLSDMESSLSLPSKAETVRRALKLFQIVTQCILNGGKVTLTYKDNTQKSIDFII